MYILRFFRAVIDQQTWTDDGSVSERRLRSALLSLACRLDDPQCVDQARELFKDWLRSNGTIRYVSLNTFLYIHHCRFLLLLHDCGDADNILLFVFPAYPQTWLGQYMLSVRRMTTAGLRSCRFTKRLSLKTANQRSCMP